MWHAIALWDNALLAVFPARMIMAGSILMTAGAVIAELVSFRRHRLRSGNRPADFASQTTSPPPLPTLSRRKSPFSPLSEKE